VNVYLSPFYTDEGSQAAIRTYRIEARRWLQRIIARFTLQKPKRQWPDYGPEPQSRRLTLMSARGQGVLSMLRDRYQLPDPHYDGKRTEAE